MNRDDNWRAWLVLAVAIAIHVWDEHLSAFLPFYNQIVLDLRSALGFFPMPTFIYPVWITGLTVLVIALLLMVGVVERGGRTIRYLAGFVSIVMIANAFAHLGGSLYLGRWVPGSASSPVLLACALWMLWRVRHGDWRYEV